MNRTALVNICYSLIVIAICLALGKLVFALIGGIPASLYGMIVLNVFLHFQLVSAQRLTDTVAWAIKNMSICFVPAGVGIIEHFDLIATHGLAIVAIIFVTTMFVITVVGYLAEKSPTLQKKTNHVKGNS